VTVKRGGTVAAHVKAVTLPGFHVNSNKPSEEYLIPLSLTWTSGPLEAKTVNYPAPETIQMGADKLSVFTGTIDIKTSFAAAGNVAPGSATMTGKLHYQACNNQMCFRPTTVEVHVPVTVE
jgi:DsbC/DsbD-like thiol-disulfide interchange protein